ncbi:MAG: phosphatase PAP2 family protein [Parvularculaceae bacterium]
MTDRGTRTVIIGALLCLLIFAAVALLVVTGASQAFDDGVLHALRRAGDPSAPAGPQWLLTVMRGVTALAGTPLLAVLTLILTGWFAARREWGSLAVLLAVVLGETALSNGLKVLFDRPRPDLAGHLVEVQTHSFPSGHATSAAAIYLTLAGFVAASAKARIVRNFAFAVAVLMAVIVGASRIYLGVHYPTDVIGGLALGTGWAAIVWIAARQFER